MFARVGEGRIVFCKPHPVPKIEQSLLQSWGRRMHKWFRWEREMIVSNSNGGDAVGWVVGREALRG
jgi:hypothetical protein